jgi:hypothetical protein
MRLQEDQVKIVLDRLTGSGVYGAGFALRWLAGVGASDRARTLRIEVGSNRLTKVRNVGRGFG